MILYNLFIKSEKNKRKQIPIISPNQQPTNHQTPCLSMQTAYAYNSVCSCSYLHMICIRVEHYSKSKWARASNSKEPSC